MSSHHPKVYCVILTCGLTPDGKARDLLLATLESVKKMTYQDFVIVVVDNGSIDGTQETVRLRHPDLTLIENGKNLGFGEGNNVGIQYAIDQGADWVILLNNDIVVDPNMLSELMKVATSDSRIGVLGPMIYYFDDPNKFWYAGGNVNFFSGIISHRGIREEDYGQYDTIEETEYVTGCAFLVKREVIERVGMFDPVYFPAYTEDADWTARILQAGFKAMYAPQAKLWHKVSSSSGGGMTPLKTRLKVEHNFIFFKRYARWYHWLTIPLCIGAVTLLFVMKELLKGNIGIVTALFSGFGRALVLLVKPFSHPRASAKKT